MSTNKHASDRAHSGHTTPPAGRDDDDTHALRSGKKGPSQRRSVHEPESPTRAAGRDDHRGGTDTGKPG